MLYFLVELFEYGYKKAHARFSKEEEALVALVLHPKCHSNMAVMVVDPSKIEDVIDDNSSVLKLEDLRGYSFNNKDAQQKCDTYFKELDRKKRDEEEFFRRNPRIAERILGRVV